MNKKCSPSELPFIGSGHIFGKDPLSFLNKLHKDFGEIAEFNVPGTHFIAVYSPKLVEQVLVKNHANYAKNVFIMERWKDFLGRGIISSEGDQWKKSRKVLQPTMTKDKFGNYFGPIAEEAAKYNHTLKDGQNITIKEDMMNSLFHALVKILFQSAEMDDTIIRRLDALFARCIDYFDYTLTPGGMLFHRFPTKAKKDYLSAIRELDELISMMLKKESPPEATDILAILKNARDDEGKPFTEKNIRDNLLSFFLAGHETTSLTITYSLFLLAQAPQEMKKVRDELKAIVGKRSPELSDIDQLKTLRNVVYESMRLYPPVGMMGRDAVGDDMLGSIPVKKGDSIIIPILAIQRSPLLYPEPDTFRPDRWIDKDMTTMRNEFLPFGVGPRLCMGANFAMMEIMAVLAILLQNHRFELVSDPKLELISSVSMRPKKEIVLKVISDPV